MKTLYLQYDDGVGGNKDNTFLSFEWVAESEVRKQNHRVFVFNLRFRFVPNNFEVKLCSR